MTGRTCRVLFVKTGHVMIEENVIIRKKTKRWWFGLFVTVKIQTFSKHWPQLFDVKYTCNFLTCLGLQNLVLISWHYHGISKKDVYPRPFIPFHITLFCSPRKWSYIMYTILNMENVIYDVISINQNSDNILYCQIYSGKS